MQKQKILITIIFLAAFLFALPASAQWSISSVADFGLPDAGVYDIVINILNWLLMVAGVVGVIGFAISGIMYLVSAGNDDQVQKAKKAMVNSIIGVVVALSGLVVIQAVDWALNAYSFF